MALDLLPTRMRCGIMADMKKLMIIGGGAAGLAAAVAATDALRAHGVRVGADGGWQCCGGVRWAACWWH